MKNKLIVALDVNSFEKAKKLIDKLSPYVNVFKVGNELFTTCGPKIVNYINNKKKKVFLDLKLFDIPNTVKGATLAAAQHGAFMLTLHAIGGADMMKEAREVLKGRKRKPLLLGVTVLTSAAGKGATKWVGKLAMAAKKSGLNGIVCSAKETKAIKKACGKNFLVINPGIRPAWAAKNDQKRVATPAEAVKSGANFIVVGRPITQAKNVITAAKRILRELK